MIGRTVSHYRILEQLGSGGMGVVYRAEDTRLGRAVAVKFLPDSTAGGDALERFRREARTASSLNHPHICTVYDVGDVDGRPFIVMELLEGETLRERLSHGPVGSDQFVDWSTEVADGLEAAHRRGIIHRDLKPANLFVTSRGSIKILDFGLAKLRPDEHGRGETRTEFQTTSGLALGTVNYMSPEQARGEEVDERTDIFSFGVVMYEMATGQQPFKGPTSAVIFDAILNRNPDPPRLLNPSTSPEIERIITKTLEKDRRVRFQTSADLLADLRRFKRDSTGGRTAAGVPPLSPPTASEIVPPPLPPPLPPSATPQPPPLAVVQTPAPPPLVATPPPLTPAQPLAPAPTSPSPPWWAPQLAWSMKSPIAAAMAAAAAAAAGAVASSPGAAPVANALKVAKAVRKGRRRRWWVPAAIVFAVFYFKDRDKGRHEPSEAPPAAASREAAELLPVQVTANPPERRVTSLAISPNGKYLAYTDPLGLYLRSTATGEATQLPDTRGMLVLAWSADGDSLRTMRETATAPGEYWDVSLLGTQRRATAGEVSPDGTRAANFDPLNRQIIITDADGGHPRPLVAYPDANTEIESAKWSPDGRFIAVAATSPPGAPESSVELVDVASGTRHTVATVPGAGFAIAGLAMLPDWRLLYAARESVDRSADFNLWQAQIDRKDGSLIGSPKRLTNWTGFAISRMSATADGKRLGFLKTNVQGDVYVASLKPGNTSMDHPRRLTLDERADVPTAWTSDSRKVIFHSTRAGTIDIYRQAVESDVAEPLVTGPGAQYGGRVSPDGRWLLFSSRQTPTATVQLNRMPIEGGPVQAIVDVPNYVHFRCGERAGCILVERKDQQDVVYDLDVMRGRGSELFRKPVGTGDPALSADGQSMAYLVGAGNHTIRMVTHTGALIRDIEVPGDVPLQSLDWSADDKGFFCTFAKEDESTLIYVPISGAPRTLRSDKSAVYSWAIPSHDGKRLAIYANTESSDVWMLEGF